MISVSRLNGSRFVLNCEAIKSLEATPDTVVTLMSGERFMVLEPVEEVIRMTIEYRKRLYQEPPDAQPKAQAAFPQQTALMAQGGIT